MIRKDDIIEIDNEASKEVFMNGGGEFSITVTISETLTREIEVFSPRQITEDDASIIVEDLYYDEKIILSENDKVYMETKWTSG